MGCKPWRENHKHRAACATCGQVVALADDGSCRLCHKQRSYLAHRIGTRPSRVSLVEANQDGQQLFFTGMWHQEGHGRRCYVKKTVPADMSLLHPVAHRQLVLLDLPRDLQAGLRNGFPPPPDAALEAAFHQYVGEYATAHGWSDTRTDRTRRAVRIMLGIQDTPAPRSAAATSRCSRRSNTPPQLSPTCWPRPACWKKTANPPWCAGSTPPSRTCPPRCVTN